MTHSEATVSVMADDCIAPTSPEMASVALNEIAVVLTTLPYAHNVYYVK